MKNQKIFKISSKYLLHEIFSYLKYNYVLNLIKYNKILQNKLNIELQNYTFSYEIDDKEITKKSTKYENTIEKTKCKKCIDTFFSCFFMLILFFYLIKLLNFFLIIFDIIICPYEKLTQPYFIIYILYIFNNFSLIYGEFCGYIERILIMIAVEDMIILLLLIIKFIIIKVKVDKIEKDDLKFNILAMIFYSISEIFLIVRIIHTYYRKYLEKKEKVNKIEINENKKIYILKKYKGFKIDDFYLPIEFNNMNLLERINFLKDNENNFIYSMDEDKIELIKLINKKRERYNIDKLKYRISQKLNYYFTIDRNRKFSIFKSIIKIDNKKYLFIYPKGEFKKKLINNNKVIMKIIHFDYLNYILILEKEENEYILIYEYDDIPINTIHIYNQDETESRERFNKRK